MAERPILFSGPMVRALLAGTKTQTRRAVKPHPSDDSFVLVDYGKGWVPYRSDDGESQSVKGEWVEEEIACPYGQPGDRLWVRETFYAFGRWEKRFSAKKCRDEWHFIDMTVECGLSYQYAADRDGPLHMRGRKQSAGVPMWWKRPAIHMPRVASRIDLDIATVRVERLQDISEQDAIAEGCITEEVVSGYDGSTIKVPAEIPHPSGVGAQGWDTAADWYADLWESINGHGSWDANPWVWVIEFRRVRADAPIRSWKELTA